MEEAVVRLVKQQQERRYGMHRAFVSDNQDPEKRGRLKLKISSVLGDEESDWALPCFPFGGTPEATFFMVPETGAQVWAEFEEGDLQRPIWVGTFPQQSSDVPQEAAKSPPTTRMLRTPGGHLLQFDDKSGEEQIHLHHVKNGDMVIDKDGGITITDAKGATVKLDANAGKVQVEDANGNVLTLDSSGVNVADASGNKVEMTAAGITVKGVKVVIDATLVTLAGQGGEPIVKGATLLGLLNSHVHMTAWGPSSPPVVPFMPSILSTKVQTS